LSVNKVSWQQVGHVTEPGRYMFRFGWLTIAAEDLAVWQQFPDASFALVKTTAASATDGAGREVTHRRSGAAAGLNPEPRDSPMCNCTSEVRALHAPE
jgi:hypothetical protein